MRDRAKQNAWLRQDRASARAQGCCGMCRKHAVTGGFLNCLGCRLMSARRAKLARQQAKEQR